MEDDYDEVERAIEVTRRLAQKKEKPDNVLQDLLQNNQKIEFQLKSKTPEQQQEVITSYPRKEDGSAEGAILH